MCSWRARCALASRRRALPLSGSTARARSHQCTAPPVRPVARHTAAMLRYTATRLLSISAWARGRHGGHSDRPIPRKRKQKAHATPTVDCAATSRTSVFGCGTRWLSTRSSLLPMHLPASVLMLPLMPLNRCSLAPVWKSGRFCHLWSISVTAVKSAVAAAPAPEAIEHDTSEGIQDHEFPASRSLRTEPPSPSFTAGLPG